MKTLCTKGYKISQADNKALAEYLLTTPKAWADSALKGMINKAVKTILKDWFEVYKEKQTDSVSASLAVIIPGIIAMEEFTPYKIQTPELPIVKRKQERSSTFNPSPESFSHVPLSAHIPIFFPFTPKRTSGTQITIRLPPFACQEIPISPVVSIRD